MSVIFSIDTGTSALLVEVDTDPRITPVDVPTGSRIIFNGVTFKKLDDGPTTNVLDNFYFGGQYIYDDSKEDEQESSSIEPNLDNAFSLTTPLLPAGTYRTGMGFEWKRNSVTTDFIANILVDDVLHGGGFVKEPKDATNYDQFTRFKPIVLSNATHKFDLNFGGESAGSTSFVQNVVFELFRVS